MITKWLLVATFVLLLNSAWGKTTRNFYTDQRLEAMKTNLQQHEWAQKMRDRILQEADKWAAYPDERLVDLVPPPQVPRAGRVSIDECPVHGQEVLKVASMYGWKMSFDEPYKVICPVGGEKYPSNDFYAYLKSGMKDKSLLTGEYVDDGYGWRQAEGDKFKRWFVAYYAHWMVRNYLHPALENLSKAYLITGDSKYAHKCALLLWQLAQYYPDYAYEKQSNYGLEIDPSYLGRLLYHTWETWTVSTTALAYDAIFPALQQDAPLQKHTGKDAAGLATDIQERLFRTMAEDIIGGTHRIHGNYGMHQKGALLIALVLDDKGGRPSSPEIVDWVLNNPKPTTLYTDSSFYDTMINLVTRDGIPFESPSYNCGWMADMAEMADLLRENGVDLWRDPRFRSIYLAPLEAVVCGRFTTPLGDSNHMFSGPLGTSPPYLQPAFRAMKDPRQAQAMVQSGGEFERDLFVAPVDEVVKTAAQEYGRETGTESSLLPGLGNLTLQTGTPGHRTGLSLFYGYYYSHIHFDLLNVDFYAEGWPLTPDLGYPETADTYDPRRFGFLAHTVVHNTCMVNAKRQEQGPGALVAFHPGSQAQMAEVTGNKAYDGVVQDYRRTVFLVDANPRQAYYVDVFHVTGGHQHDWLVHGTEATFDASVPFGAARTEGTLAGPEVPYGHFYDDEKFKESRYGLYYYNYKGSAFQWLTDVQQAELTPTDQAAPWVRWSVNRDPKLFPNYPAGAKLRSHLVPDQETVFACDGVPVRRPKFPEKLKWVVRRRTGPDEKLSSTFVTVHEGYQENPVVQSVRRLAVTPAEGAVALEVRLSGRRDIIFAARRLDREYTVDGRLRIKGRGAVVSFVGTRPTMARLFDGATLTGAGLKVVGSGVRTSAIAALDYGKGIVTLKTPCLKPADVGRWVPLSSGQHETSVRIEKVLSPERFSIGTQDLRVARGVPQSLAGKVITSNAQMYFAGPGMTLVNEGGRALSRLAARSGLSLTTATEVTLEQLSDQDGDGQRRFTVMAAGPGDVISLGSGTAWPASR